MENNRNTQFLSNDRGIFIDPNFGNENVQIEDLSIEVDLSVFERPRSFIKVTEDTMGEAKKKRIANMKGAKVPFNQGREFGTGNYSFTTDYTRVSDPDYDGRETLGIESVEIEFNSSYMPMINIELTDVRGKLFQMGSDSPYSAFFNFPYPLFELKIKGFYGKPVVYLLHLTKFNSKLDSGSGNFKISCNFIGYTYAYLSDMLLGYLKAIPHTYVGNMLLKKKEQQGIRFVTFKQLYEYANNLNLKVSELRNSKEAKALSVAHDVLHKYQEIKNRLRNELESLDATNFDTKNTDNQLVFLRFENNGNLSYFFDDALKNILNDINVLNEKKITGETYDFNTDVYKSKEGYNHFFALKKEDFLDEDNIIRESYSGNQEYFKTNEDEFRYIGRKIQGLRDNVGRDTLFHMIYIKEIITDIDSKHAALALMVKEKETNFAHNNLDDLTTVSITNKDGDEMNFDFNIYSYTKVLADHVDLLMESIEVIAGEAEANQNRNSDLKKDAENLYDIHNVSTLDKIYAFPDYKTKSKNSDSQETNSNSNVFVDSWIGKDYPDINEAEFIRDLYKGLIEAKRVDNAALDNQILEHPYQWYSINPFDTGLYTGHQNVWAKVANSTEIGAHYEIIRLMVMRAIIFMNVSVRNPSKEEIKAMAEMEANNSFYSIQDNTTKLMIARIGDSSNANNIVETIRKEVEGGTELFRNDLEPVNQNSIVGYSKRYTEGGVDWGRNNPTEFEDYMYIGGHDELTEVSELRIEGQPLDKDFKTFLPLFFSGNANNFDGQILITNNEGKLTTPQQRIDLRNEGNIFFGDYLGPVATENNKPDDGATYIDFKTTGQYDIQITTPKYGSEVLGNNKVDYTKVWTIDELNDIKSHLKNVMFNGKWKNLEFTTYKDGDVDYPFANFFYRKPNFSEEIPEIEFHIENTTFFEYIFTPTGNFDTYKLFGSSLYYGQNILGKAFLFLQSLPFKKTLGNIINESIRPLLDSKAASIQVPYAWILYIGAILYRKDERQEADIINFRENNLILPEGGVTNNGRDKMLTAFEKDHAYSATFASDSHNFDNVLDNLPEVAKQKFMDEFYNWAIADDGYGYIRQYLEIFRDNEDGGTLKNIAKLWVDNPSESIDLFNTMFRGTIAETYNRVGHYKGRGSSKIIKKINELQDGDNSAEYLWNKIVKPIAEEYGYPFNFDIERNESGMGVQVLKLFMEEKRMLINGTWRIWVDDKGLLGTGMGGNTNTIEGSNHPFTVTVSNLNDYVTYFIKEFIRIKGKNEEAESTIQRQIFDNTNLDEIYLTIYKNVKSVYDKWITGHSSNMLSFRNLIETFNFIDRGYNDIGVKFKLNPLNIKDLLETSYNNSFYSHISKVLSNNNFDFIPMPNFVNLNNKSEMETLFKPYSYNAHDVTQSSTFVCMYSGEQSSVLDDNEYFQNDGFNVEDKDSLPEDFKEVPGIFVNYGDENQSIFTSIELDQSEYSETNESILVTDQIASSYNNVNTVGQNLFNIYNNRAYNVTIGMLGNAMLQPFMYFQLNNIPMFRGAYVVTKVGHSIQPNYMTTSIKGNRVKRVKTQLIDKEAIFYNLIGSFSDIQNAEGNLDDLNSITNDPVTASGESTSLNIGNYNGDPYHYTFKKTTGKQYNFDINSNTQKRKSDGTFAPMTYTEIFNEVSKITAVPVLTLKTLSVVESSIGQYKGDFFKRNYMNELGYVGLMQFHRDATIDVEKSINNTLKDKLTIGNYKFHAVVDTAGKKIKRPSSWTNEPEKNNPQTNSMFDDFISTLAAAYYVRLTNNGRDGKGGLKCGYSHVTNMYLAHQQGVGGLKTILKNPITQFENNKDIHPPGVTRNMNNNLPKTYDHTKKSYTYQEWYLAWAGHVEAIAGDCDEKFELVVGDDSDNMKLSPSFHLAQFKSKDGAKTPPNVIDNLKELAKNLEVIKEFFGGKAITINSGYRSPTHNQKEGGTSESQHLYGRAADIVVQGVSPDKVRAGILKLISEGKITEGGLGKYNSFTHYDIRGTQARWFDEYWASRSNNYDPNIDNIV